MGKSPFDQFPSIRTKEITLRKIVSADLDLLFEIYSNENLFRYSPNMLKKNKDTVSNMIGHFGSLNVLACNGVLTEGMIRQGYIWKGKGVTDLVERSMIKSEYTKRA